MNGTKLTGARPSAAPVLKCASQRAEDGETGLGNPFRASPEGERRRGGMTMRRRGGGHGCSVGARSSAGEVERRAGEGLLMCGILRESSGWLL
jgi:hypothetical protein